mmetsp:Transcript_46470/g.108880  ORF Transcript_46470/g.108880 Transcript_46470/m.108880 type:complete len:234 (-) Transcript_46470:1495-2196(-)
MLGSHLDHWCTSIIPVYDCKRRFRALCIVLKDRDVNPRTDEDWKGQCPSCAGCVWLVGSQRGRRRETELVDAWCPCAGCPKAQASANLPRATVRPRLPPQKAGAWRWHRARSPAAPRAGGRTSRASPQRLSRSAAELGATPGCAPPLLSPHSLPLTLPGHPRGDGGPRPCDPQAAGASNARRPSPLYHLWPPSLGSHARVGTLCCLRLAPAGWPGPHGELGHLSMPLAATWQP